MNNKNKKSNLSKTEFLFESDAEKAVLNDALKPKKAKIYKIIIINTILITFLLIGSTYLLNYYQASKLNVIKATVNNVSDFKEINEKMNQSSNKLEIIHSNTNNKYDIIINKSNPINEDTISNYKLVDVEENLYSGIKLEEETYANYLKLKENLQSRKYYINIRSGFRSFNESNMIYNEYIYEKGKDYAEKYVAKPGASEHNAGISFDFIISTNKNSIKTNYESDEYFYLENIAYLYGFIIRYPKDKEQITGYSYEPWHLRYVGTELAKYLKKNNLALEEYYKTEE